MGCSVQHCSKYGFTVDGIFCMSTNRNVNYFLQNVGAGTADTAHMQLELIFIRNDPFRLNLLCFEYYVQFLARDSMLSMLYAIASPSVCLSVCHTGGSVENG